MEEEKIYISKKDLEKIKKLKEQYVYFDYGIMDTRIKHTFQKYDITTALDFCSAISGYRIYCLYGLGEKSMIKLRNYLLRLGIVIEGFNDDENIKQLEIQKED